MNEYQIATAYSARALVELVNEKLAKGWKIVGGVACSLDPYDPMTGVKYDKPMCWYHQAMKVKKDKYGDILL